MWVGVLMVYAGLDATPAPGLEVHTSLGKRGTGLVSLTLGKTLQGQRAEAIRTAPANRMPLLLYGVKRRGCRHDWLVPALDLDLGSLGRPPPDGNLSQIGHIYPRRKPGLP